MDVGNEWFSTQHQSCNPLERSETRNTAQLWRIALEITKEMESCLKKLDPGVSRKRRLWATQQKAEINKLELGNRLGRTWQNLLLKYFEDAMRAPSSALPLMANPFIRTAGQLMFTWSLAGVVLDALASHDKLKLRDKGLRGTKCWCSILLETIRG